ncbi:hypothetical protein DZ834_08985, partial [Campylobacter jejuni]|nr:hypothetical protein [Campylobacter jejuni]EBF5701533.1 hypothetical protein [Campylobacter jejuni]
KNIDDEYIPNIPKEAKIALKDREIKLTKGSLLKLIEKDRIKYIPHIKETLESPQAILKDKDALDNYIKVDKEQNKILKDALIKEGVIKGDNFFMDKADPKDNSLRFIGKNDKEYTINKDVRNEWMKTFNL